MGKYIDFEFLKTDIGFSIKVINKSNHALFGQVFRQGILKVSILRNNKTIKLKPFIFERILAKDGKKAMPWNANETLKDTLIYAKKDVVFREHVQSGDDITVTLCVQRISHEGMKKLGIKKNKELTKCKILKTQKFKF